MNSDRPSLEQSVSQLQGRFESALDAEALRHWQDSLEKLKAKGAATLPAIWPLLVRRFGPEPFCDVNDPGRFLQSQSFLLDLAAFRRADVAALLLARQAIDRGEDPVFLRDLFDHGDLDERIGVMRCLPVLEGHPVVVQLMGETQRSNTQHIVEAGYCDHDTPVRHLGDEDFNRLILKLAFIDFPLWRVLRAETRANAALSFMLQNFATEREAADRPIWKGSLRLIASSPVEGSAARIIGHVEHGHDGLRHAAVESLAILGDPSLIIYAEQRLGRERHPAIIESLKKTIEHLKAQR